MTGFTSQILMLAFQFEIGILVMIKTNFAPAFLCVTTITAFAVVAIVRIMHFMAGKAHCLGFFLEHIAFMTILAKHIFVRAV